MTKGLAVACALTLGSLVFGFQHASQDRGIFCWYPVEQLKSQTVAELVPDGAFVLVCLHGASTHEYPIDCAASG